MHTDVATASAPQTRRRRAIASMLVGGIILAYVIWGVALYAILSLAV
jgi:hypothetical protein